MNDNIIRVIEENNVEAIFVTNKYDITYVSNFTGEKSYVLLTSSQNYIITDKRYIEQAKKQCTGFNVMLFEKLEFDLKQLLTINKIRRLGIDICDISHKLYKDITGVLKDMEIVDLEKPFMEYRAVKSTEEIEKIKMASEIADKSYYRILQMISEGMSEKDIEIELDYTIKREGGDGYAFDPIIGAGRKSSIPYSWADKSVHLNKGDILLLNFGVKYEGYTAALARTIAVGNIEEKYKKIYKNVFNIYTRILELVKPYMKYEDLYDSFKELISHSEYKDYFLRSLGHIRGLETIEEFIIKPDVKRIMRPNEVYSIGVSISVPDFGGARLEDAVLIKEDGVVKLTNSAVNLLSV